MPRKPVPCQINFHYPGEEEGKRLLAEVLGEVHTKIIKEILDTGIMEQREKNRVLAGIEKRLNDQDRGADKDGKESNRYLCQKEQSNG